MARPNLIPNAFIIYIGNVHFSITVEVEIITLARNAKPNETLILYKLKHQRSS